MDALVINSGKRLLVLTGHIVSPAQLDHPKENAKPFYYTLDAGHDQPTVKALSTSVPIVVYDATDEFMELLGAPPAVEPDE